MQDYISILSRYEGCQSEALSKVRALTKATAVSEAASPTDPSALSLQRFSKLVRIIPYQDKNETPTKVADTSILLWLEGTLQHGEMKRALLLAREFFQEKHPLVVALETWNALPALTFPSRGCTMIRLRFWLILLLIIAVAVLLSLLHLTPHHPYFQNPRH